MIIFGYLFLEEVAVQLVAGLADGQTAAILVEDLNLLVVEVITAVVQLAGTVEVVAFDTFERHVAEADGRQTAVDEIATEGAQNFVVRVLPVLHGHHHVVVVDLGKAVEVERGKRKVESGKIEFPCTAKDGEQELVGG